MSGFLDTQSTSNQIEAIYIAYFGRAGDGPGQVYWTSQFANFMSQGASVDQAAILISQSFSVQPEAKATYGFLNPPPSVLNPNDPTQVAGVDTFIEQIYQDLFNRKADAAGLAYWQNQILTGKVTVGAAVYTIGNGATGIDQTVLGNKITAATYFTTNTFGANLGTTVPLQPSFVTFAHGSVTPVNASSSSVTQSEATSQAYVLYGPGVTFTLTTSQDTFTSPGFATFNAPLAGLLGTQPTLTNGDNLTVTTPGAQAGSSLFATFDGSDTVTGLNITGVATWHIDADVPPPTVPGLPGGSTSTTPYGTIALTGDAGPSGNVISGLTTLIFDDHSNAFSLDIGNNTEPVQEPNGANGFTIYVSNAVGTGDNGVDVDIQASAFTGTDTINVTANVVGGFPLDSGGSLIVPDPILGTHHDPDDYNPNWAGFLDDAFAIAAGASSGPKGTGLPTTGAIGFQTWDIASIGAQFVEPNIQIGNWVMPTGVNIIALGGEGSWTATTLNLTDDGSSTILFATFTSDSLLTDWKNLATINLAGTSGFVVLTGLEATNQLNAFHIFDDGGGLLTDDTTALTTIVGGLGNSFYDLSSLTLAAAHAATLIQGGTGTAGNSEVAFNNSVVASVSTTNPLGLTVNIQNIQVLDDTGTQVNASFHGGYTVQGGTINMADFATLQPLNVPYTLIGGGTVPAGYQLLQFLNGDGSTASWLNSDLSILNGPVHFAINMQDLADGNGSFVTALDGTALSPMSSFKPHNITIVGEAAVPTVNVLDHLIVYVSDDGVDLGKTNSQVQMGVSDPTALNVPVFTVDNYTTVDIWMPFEGITGSHDTILQPNYVVLGSTAFVDQPVVSVPILGGTAATLNFYDNTADTGGSPPGGPDDLVLGHTNFFAALSTNDIGVTTVFVDATAATTTINDFGAGTFEIGATDATNLNAQSTAGLFMDLPGTLTYVHTDGLATPAGITVNGSTTHQNLLQGTSGQVFVDLNGDHGTVFPALSPGFQGVGTFGGSSTANGNPVTDGGVGNTVETSTLPGFYQVGNDTLTGGVADTVSSSSGHFVPGGVQFTETGGLMGVGVTYFGNSGDNFFPEGGNDTVNIAHITPSAGDTVAYSTVWVAMYDVCNSGGSNYGTSGLGPNSGVGQVSGQAVTDIVNGAETYVDGYGPGTGTSTGSEGPTGSTTSSLTITGFVPGNTLSHGDILNFNVNDWATGTLTKGTDYGLVNENGVSMAGLGTHNADAFINNIGFAGEFASGTFTVTLDSIGAYDNAAQLVKALTTFNVGDINFGVGSIFSALNPGDVEHMLVGYQTTKGDLHIADVSLTNNTGSTIGGLFGLDTATSGVTVKAVDMVDLVGVNLANFNQHNLHFV